MTDLTVSGDITYDSIVQPKVKILEIGTWNMDGNLTVSVAHGLTLANIRSISAIIRRDDGIAQYPLNYSNIDNNVGGTYYCTATNATLIRTGGGFFDDSLFDTMGGDGNRGWITITYV